MSLIKLKVSTNSEKYSIIIGNNILKKVNKFLAVMVAGLSGLDPGSQRRVTGGTDSGYRVTQPAKRGRHPLHDWSLNQRDF